MCAVLLQFHVDCFKTLQMFWSWSEDVLDIIVRSFLLLFSQVEAFIFIKVTRSDSGKLVCATTPTLLC